MYKFSVKYVFFFILRCNSIMVSLSLRLISIEKLLFAGLKVGCLHPVACTRSGSGFLSNATLF
jgi:hypothetical protein